MAQIVHFDEAIPIAIRAVRNGVVPVSTEQAVHLVRDTTGSIVIILPDKALADESWEVLAEHLNHVLGAYSPGNKRVLLRESDLIVPDDILLSLDKVALESPNVWLVDRLLTNQDWLRPPLLNKSEIPLAVAFSIKGGVGRSTAFSMFAWYLARKGRDVLLVDLDLEAPGLGSLLLPNAPLHGLVDWLIENINGHADHIPLESMISEAPIAHDSTGRLRVLPAYGEGSREYIAKLGRIYGSSMTADGQILGIADRLVELVHSIEKMDDRPEVILLDSRAGLHDIGSAAVTRLGAEAFLFARNDEQDWWAYRQIFSHLRHSASVSAGMGNEEDLRWKLKMVAAQTAPNESARRDWLDRSYAEWIEFYDDERVESSDSFNPIGFSREDIAAPHFPLYINYEPTIRAQSLLEPALRPEWDYVEGVFGNFFHGAEERLWPETANEYEVQGED